ncbi:unnamed protein product [Acanthoscelides obtectus]|uniref:Uncharacterized protein n=1 Tax=Acanthoscelides obtectus TaxID=200917 RepID=A0A9P0NX83_ACAOB|nr:unnamed protein product [Acanthoscelides obtectus]CAK1632095.1 hypothetical protein AOBTE_LOCUS7362 [Acanthoscelides obtectus]
MSPCDADYITRRSEEGSRVEYSSVNGAA